jgi:Holliday junction resolvase
MLFDNKWVCLRVAGSGSSTELATDLLAGKGGRVLAIECKSGAKGKRYLKPEQIEELKEFSKKFGAEAWLAVRYDYVGWYFIQPKHLIFTKNGIPVIDSNIVEKKGISFKDLIKK